MHHLFFCVADHFEPYRCDGQERTPDLTALKRVEEWTRTYPEVFGEFRDADGRPPQHTFFYPEEEYAPVVLDRLAELCGRGFGEVEIHLHHRNDSEAGLRDKLERFRDVLHRRHGLLGIDPKGSARFGFIHGNWALCNSRPDGDWCGVNEELRILRQAGCYADFTFPSAPSATQPRTVNAIYRATDRMGHSRGHDFGLPVAVRQAGVLSDPDTRNSLLLIQGPLALNWIRRKWGLLPRLENGEISGVNPPSEDRIRLWVRQYIHVQGRPEWVFVKVHTHGCVDVNQQVFLGQPMKKAHRFLNQNYNDGVSWCLHYVTAREMYNLVRAAEDGVIAAPESLRDFEIQRPVRNIST